MSKSEKPVIFRKFCPILQLPRACPAGIQQADYIAISVFYYIT